MRPDAGAHMPYFSVVLTPPVRPKTPPSPPREAIRRAELLPGKGAVAVDIAGRGRQHRRQFGLILHVRGGDLDGIEQGRILTGRDVPL